MESNISATEAARSFSELLNRIRYRGESFVVERGGIPICRMTAATPSTLTLETLARLLAAAPHPDGAFLDELEAHVRRQQLESGPSWES